MNFLITRSSKLSQFSPEEYERLDGVTEQYAQGYIQACKNILKDSYNFYISEI